MIVDPDNVLRSVDIVLQVMAKAAYRHKGLFPAVAERQNGSMLMDFPLPPPIPGQRNSDRSPRGCNLQHDIPLLGTLDGLALSLGRERYRLQRDAYLQRFAVECAPPSPTGLLPWGEHAYWNLHLGVIGNSYILQYGEQPLDAGIPTHHQLRTLPVDQWRVIHAANAEVLPRFVDGLDWHWMDEERTQFNRHAPITQLIRGYQIKRHEALSGKPAGEIRGSDFPGTAGAFIHNYAVALALVEEPRSGWRGALERFEESWWRRRLASGVCPASGSTDPLKWNGPSLGQTLTLAERLLEASALIENRDSALARRLRSHGTEYVRAVLSLEQPGVDEGSIAVSWNEDGSPNQRTQLWSGNRGTAITAELLIKLLNAAVAVEDDRGVNLALRAAAPYLNCRIPRRQIVRAADPGSVIGLLVELARVTGDHQWLDAALRHATDALELYFDSPLPRVAIGRNHYEAQQGSGVLVHALARLYLVSTGREPEGELRRPVSFK